MNNENWTQIPLVKRTRPVFNSVKSDEDRLFNEVNERIKAVEKKRGYSMSSLFRILRANRPSG